SAKACCRASLSTRESTLVGLGAPSPERSVSGGFSADLGDGPLGFCSATGSDGADSAVVRAFFSAGGGLGAATASGATVSAETGGEGAATDAAAEGASTDARGAGASRDATGATGSVEAGGEGAAADARERGASRGAMSFVASGSVDEGREPRKATIAN